MLISREIEQKRGKSMESVEKHLKDHDHLSQNLLEGHIGKRADTFEGDMTGKGADERSYQETLQVSTNG